MKKTTDPKIKGKEKPKTISVFDASGKEIDQIKINEDLFTIDINGKVLYQAVNMYLANQRQGNAKTKTRKEVSGGGIKPWRQKGTGRARVGSIRSPLWRHGGIVFGPIPRDYSYDLPKKVKTLALRNSIASKMLNSNLIVVDEIDIKEPKTKHINAMLEGFKINESCLLCTTTQDKNIYLASRNIPNLTFKIAKDVNALDLMRNKKLLATKKAFELLCQRVKI